MHPDHICWNCLAQWTAGLMAWLTGYVRSDDRRYWWREEES